ncbi:MAG: tetratricopeptide repeat protein [Magnetococcales bacterium]|nr:tetratricopeptide repeat protein [Magnetococcales bacterium]
MNENTSSQPSNSGQSQLTVDAAYAQAIDHFYAERYTEADLLCTAIIKAKPNHIYAINLLGLIAQNINRHDLAVEQFKCAINIDNRVALLYYNLGTSLFPLGRMTEVVKVQKKALDIDPNYVEAYSSLGAAYTKLKRFDESVVCLQKAITIKPDFAEAHYNLGFLKQEQESFNEAVSSYQKAITIKPDFADAHSNLGNVLQQQGKLEEAITSCQKAIIFKPDFAEAHYNIGNALQQQGKLEEAVTSLQKAITIKPDFADTYSSLGIVLQKQGKLDEAAANLQEAINIKPDFAEAHSNLGNVLQQQGKLEEAITSCQKAIIFKPDFAEAHYNLGIVLQQQGKLEEAVASLQKAITIKPDFSKALGIIYRCNEILCHWQNILDDAAAIHQLLAQNVATSPFTFLSFPEDDGFLQRHVSKLHVVEQMASILSKPPLIDPGKHTKSFRLRIGYLSADFQNHATAQLLTGVLEAHNHNKFAIYAYSYGNDSQDTYRRRIVSSCDLFRDLSKLSYIDCARQIVDDKVDILIDLKGFTRGCRSEITALRPAPIIVNWLGYPGTLGHPRMADYLIGDPVVSPPYMSEQFSETLALLPHCYQPNDHNRIISTNPKRQDSGLPVDKFVFCCFNQSYKITPEGFDVWCRLLNAVPNSVLWLLSPGPSAITNLCNEATRRGVNPSRLIFTPILPIAEHLGRLSLADLALDTFPVTSHTTGSDALWAGVPLITRIGNTFVSRVAASLLHSIGLPQLVTKTWEEYFELALELTKNRDRLQSIRNELSENRSTCPLFDTNRFTRDLERIYERMWQDHGQGKKDLIKLNDKDISESRPFTT